jgi:hypothetical protein
MPNISHNIEQITSRKSPEGGVLMLAPVVGNSLFDKDFVEKVRYARSKKNIMDIDLASNGILLTREKFEELARAGLLTTRGEKHAFFVQIEVFLTMPTPSQGAREILRMKDLTNPIANVMYSLTVMQGSFLRLNSWGIRMPKARFFPVGAESLVTINLCKEA